MNKSNEKNNELRADKIEKLLDRGIIEGSCVVLNGNTSDTFVYDGHLSQLPQLISIFSAKRQMPTLMFSLDKQVEELQAPNGPKVKWMPSVAAGTAPTVVLDRIFESLEKSQQPTTFIVNHVGDLIKESGGHSLDDARMQQQILNRVLSASFRMQGHLLILISRIRPVNTAFAQMTGITSHSVALPGQPEREISVQIMMQSKEAPLIVSQDITPERLGRLSGGLSIDALSRLRRTTNEANPLVRNTVLERKKDLIRQQSGNTLTIHDDERDLDNDIAGLAQLKLHVKNLKEEGLTSARVLLLGPPGTGKTLSAVAIAKSMDTIPISLAQVKTMWVGESERMFRRVIDIIESNSPVTLILDECDQLTMGSRSGKSAAPDSSSVDTSLRGMLLEWLGDVGAVNGISIIAMSNNAIGVDPAFRDRLTTIPILEACSASDKARIAMIQLRRMGIEGDEAGIAAAFAEERRNFTGRQIVKMLGKGARTANEISGGVVGYEAMKTAVKGMIRSFGLSEELMSLRAIRYTDEAEYLPWVAAQMMGDDAAQAPEYLKPFLSGDGTEYDESRLDDRIAELVSRGF